MTIRAGKAFIDVTDISGVIAEAVSRGYTITIGPHKDAPCVLQATKDGKTWGKGCRIDAEAIRRILSHLPAVWNWGAE